MGKYLNQVVLVASNLQNIRNKVKIISNSLSREKEPSENVSNEKSENVSVDYFVQKGIIKSVNSPNTESRNLIIAV